MRIRSVRSSEAGAWERMRQELWPSSAGEHAGEIARFLAGNRDRPAEVLVALDDGEQPVGFVELSIRPFAEECYSGRVAYLEGWFVEPAARRRGYGAALIEAAEAWAREEGCTEFASDTALDNPVGDAAHRATGFTEVGRMICFRKTL